MTNLITNPGFEDGTANWTYYNSGSGTFEAAGESYEGTKCAKLTHTEAGSNIQLMQTGITGLASNTAYELTFKCRSSRVHKGMVALLKNSFPYTNYGLNQEFTFGMEDWTNVTIEFMTNSAEIIEPRFAFMLGSSVTSDPAQNGDVNKFDIISLSLQLSPSSSLSPSISVSASISPSASLSPSAGLSPSSSRSPSTSLSPSRSMSASQSPSASISPSRSSSASASPSASPSPESPLEYALLVEIELDGGTKRYSHRGFDTPDGLYKNLLINIAPIRRTAPIFSSSLQFDEASFTFSDLTKEFRALRATEAFRNRTIRVRFGDVDRGYSYMIDLFTGRILNDEFDKNGQFIVTARSIAFAQLQRELPEAMTKANFPDLPPGTPPYPAPIIAGEVSCNGSTPEGGACPCYLVTQSAPYRYVVAQHECVSILRVFKYGSQLSSAAYDVTTSVINGKTYTFLDFDYDQRDDERLNELEIWADVQGFRSGAYLATNPATQLYTILLNFFGIPSTELDYIGINLYAGTPAANAQYTGSAWIGGLKRKQADVIEAFQRSFLMTPFVDRTGLFSLRLLTLADALAVDASTLETLTDKNDIIRESFTLKSGADSNRLAASKIIYRYKPKWKSDGGLDYMESDEQSSTYQEEQLNESAPMYIDMPYISSASVAAKVAAAYLFYARENAQHVFLDLPVSKYTLDLADRLAVTHFRGTAPDGGGYVSVAMQIMSLQLNLQPPARKITAELLRLIPKGGPTASVSPSPSPSASPS